MLRVDRLPRVGVTRIHGVAGAEVGMPRLGVMLRGPVSMMLLMMMSPVFYRRQAGVNPVSHGE